MTTVLITGGGGSLGAQLSLLLSGRGHAVRVFDLPQLDYGWAEGVSGIEIVGGDITEKDSFSKVVEGVETVIHLAGLLPPRSEEDWERTEAVNVGGTKSLLEALEATGANAHVIFSSTVAVYGDTYGTEKPLESGEEPNPNDCYSRSKSMAEGLVTRSGLPYTILRISGIAVPAFLEPPQVWPFMEEQRMEFVCRDDVMTAVTNCVGNKEARGEVFNIAGGEHWRMTGREYVKSLFDVMGVAPEAASYLEGPGWFDWYHTADSQAVLDYQKTTFRDYLNRIEQSLKELMG